MFKQNNGKQFQHLCHSCLPASERFFVEQFLRNYVSLLLFSEPFCFSNFSISCSVEQSIADPRHTTVVLKSGSVLSLLSNHCQRPFVWYIFKLESILLMQTNRGKPSVMHLWNFPEKTLGVMLANFCSVQ